MGRRPDSWSTRQLGEFLTLISSFDDERSAVERGIERAAEMLEAEAAALVRGDSVIASFGFPAGEAPVGPLAAVAGGDSASIELPGLGRCAAIAMPLEGDGPLRLVVARYGEGLNEEELDLLRGIGQVLTLGLRALRLLSNERALRERSEGQAKENARLLGAVRERQGLLERLAALQRLVVERVPLQELLDAVVVAASELLGDELAAVRLIDRDDPEHTTLSAAVGADPERLERTRRAPASAGLGGRAMADQRRVVALGEQAAEGELDFAVSHPAAAMVVPVFEADEVVGSLGVATRRDRRGGYGTREQATLQALAELMNLALNHARAIEDVAHEAFHDSITGLPNRALFLDRLEHALARSRRGSSQVGVLFVDLDGFKTINDSLGPNAGDALLVAVAARLADRLRPADTVARLGGDEYAVLLEEVEGPGDAARAAGRILDAFGRPFELDGREVLVSASIGIAVGAPEADELLRNADLAMYRAKGRGKSRYEVFEPAMHTAVVERLELELDLKRAVERDELELHYQPIFDLRAGQISALEALVRWRHPDRGLVPPETFVPLAEETGQVTKLGGWVLRTACHQAALWRARYPAFPGLQVCVNLSGVQLREPRLASDVDAALRASQLEASGLVLEITETVLMEDTEASVSRLAALKRLGIRLVIDDFGTGYSSLRYLSRFPLDALKIERSFTERVGGPHEESELVRAIADLGGIFGLSVVAEGVERSDQPARLLELGCDFGQGHHLSEPLPAEAADALLLRSGLLGPGPKDLPRPVAQRLRT